MQIELTQHQNRQCHIFIDLSKFTIPQGQECKVLGITQELLNFAKMQVLPEVIQGSSTRLYFSSGYISVDDNIIKSAGNITSRKLKHTATEVQFEEVRNTIPNHNVDITPYTRLTPKLVVTLIPYKNSSETIYLGITHGLLNRFLMYQYMSTDHVSLFNRISILQECCSKFIVSNMSIRQYLL